MTNTRKILDELSVAIQSTAMTAQAQRKLSKAGFSFSDLPVAKQILIWDQVWKSPSSFWHKIHAFFYCETLLKRPDDLISIWPIIQYWQNHVDHWRTCDCLSKIYSKILEIDSTLVLPILVEWNFSEDPWKRRQSIVSLLYYHSVRKKYLPYHRIIQMVDNLIADSEYYVQKAVGWTLRELYRTYPVQTLDYFYDKANQLSSTAFSTIGSVLNATDKVKMKKIRRSKK